MPDLTAFISDRRYSVPTLRVVPADAASRADEIARRILDESPWHIAVELRVNDRLVLALQRDDAPSAGSAGSRMNGEAAR